MESTEQEFSTDLFAEFWLLYPRKVARIKAARSWKRLTKAERIAALSALVHWRRIWAHRDESDFTPHPSTWLNGERWEDELPPEYIARAQSHLPAVLPEKVARGEIPEHVKAMLAKLRAK